MSIIFRKTSLNYLMDEIESAQMTCPICLDQLTPRARESSLDCSVHCIFHVDLNNQCDRYIVLMKNLYLKGDKNLNYTKIYSNNYLYKDLIKITWIPIKLNNLPKDIPKLFNKLMKLKAFA